MTWDEVLKFIVMIVGSLGGGSAIVVGATKWGTDLIKTKVEADINHRYEKAIEEYKTELEEAKAKYNTLLQNTSYITQKQYDLEVDIYREIWNDLVELTDCFRWISDFKILNRDIMNESDLETAKVEHYKSALSRLEKYRKTVNTNAPFYQESAYVIMNNIAERFETVVNIFHTYMEEIGKLSEEDAQKIDKAVVDITKWKDQMTVIVRNYLNSLKHVKYHVENTLEFVNSDFEE